MFKKLLIASLVLGSSCGVAFAHHKHDYKSEQANVSYKGEVAAPCFTYPQTPRAYIGASIGPVVNITGSPSAFQGFSGILSLGYGAFLQPNFYLAGEIFGQGIAQIKNYNNNSTGLSGKQTSAFGLDIIPGYMITDYVLGYIRLGVDRGHFNNTGSGNSNATGWRVGLGGQTNIYQNWDLRGEYVYNQYNNISTVGKVLSNQFNLGLVYKFA